MRELGARAFPSLVFLDGDGEMARVLVGVQPAAAVIQTARAVASSR